ncbi:MAG: ATPase [Candidatus Altiarchaeales archaeon HGW-Altiarchaeales-3]|nr:MAG: ATPase [Candidatus Altiarchaeales archaeon HGW-Altiarchaeales-3]
MLSHEEIIQIISDVNLWGRDQETGTNRKDYIKRLNELSVSREDAIAIIGMRRTGKTYLAKQFLKNAALQTNKEQTLYVNFEEPKLDPYLSLPLLDEIYNAYRTYINRGDFAYIVLDEIQNIDRWEKWVRMMQEKQAKVKIIVTGSSSKLMSSEFATVLTGRSLKLEVYPLSFKEFLYFKGMIFKTEYDILTKSNEIQMMLPEYLEYGGLPKVVLENNKVIKKEFLKEVFDGIIYRDVISRYNIQDTYLTKLVAEFGINYFSTLMSANKLRNTLINVVKRKISPNLVIEILNHIIETYLIFSVPIYSNKIKDQKQYPKKIYCIDAGLINVIAFKLTENWGRIYENTVAVELKKRKKEIYYWKDKNQWEVDFVIKEGPEINELIQVSYDIGNIETKNREIKSLIKASGELKCTNLLVITRDYEGREEINGVTIKFKLLWKWLLA